MERGRQDPGSDGAGAAAAARLWQAQGVWVVSLSGEVDLDAEGVILDTLAEAQRRAAEGPIVVDLSGLRFADSVILNALLRAARRAPLDLAGPLHPDVLRLFQVTGTARRFTVHADLESALG